MTEGLIESIIEDEFSDLREELKDRREEIEENWGEEDIEYHRRMVELLEIKESLEDQEDSLEEEYGHGGEFLNDLNSAREELEQLLEEGGDEDLEEVLEEEESQSVEDDEVRENSSSMETGSEEKDLEETGSEEEVVQNSGTKYTIDGEREDGQNYLSGILIDLNSENAEPPKVFLDKSIDEEKGECFVFLNDTGDAEPGDRVTVNADLDSEPYSGDIEFIKEKVDELKDEYVVDEGVELNEGEATIPVETEDFEIAPELTYVASEIGFAEFDLDEIFYEDQDLRYEVEEKLQEQGLLELGDEVEVPSVPEDDKRVIANLVAGYNPPYMKGDIDWEDERKVFNPYNAHGSYMFEGDYDLGSEVMVEVGDFSDEPFEVVEVIEEEE